MLQEEGTEGGNWLCLRYGFSWAHWPEYAYIKNQQSYYAYVKISRCYLDAANAYIIFVN